MRSVTSAKSVRRIWVKTVHVIPSLHQMKFRNLQTWCELLVWQADMPNIEMCGTVGNNHCSLLEAVRQYPKTRRTVRAFYSSDSLNILICKATKTKPYASCCPKLRELVYIFQMQLLCSFHRQAHPIEVMTISKNSSFF